MGNIIRSDNKIAFVMQHECLHASEVVINKKMIQEGYTYWGEIADSTSYLNWGIWDTKIHDEFLKLHYDYSSVNNRQSIYSLLLLYYVVRPLINNEFFNKRLLDIGSGNGIGLKIASQLLKAKYSLGIDLTHKLVSNSIRNFYLENEINYIQSDAEHIPISNESVDIITNIESSHNYPRIEHFFAEVERVLAPGGYFCYTDSYIPIRSQSERLEQCIKKSPNLKIIQKINITKLVQASIYKRLIINEDSFYEIAFKFLEPNSPHLAIELLYLAYAMGLIFLPWWKIRFKRPELSYIAKAARRDKFWKKKYYFYYLVQKV
jgi:ubiquinone/menaquinone biosynthesis C-methylase UbiE